VKPLGNVILLTAVIILFSTAITAQQTVTVSALYNQIITNTQKIVDMDREIQEIRSWILTHDRAVMQEGAQGKIVELQTKVDTIWKILIGLVIAILGTWIKLVADLFSRKK